jgi:hypothetical protein
VSVQLYDHSAQVDWESDWDGDYARRYLSPLMNQNVSVYVANVHAHVHVLRHEGLTIPFTISDYHPENSYVVSPFNHYFVYGLEELEMLDNPVLIGALRGMIAPIKRLYTLIGFDGVVMLNNWLLSTNLWTQTSQAALRCMIDCLSQAYPERAIVFRSVDAHANPELYSALEALGCTMVFSRKVYYQDNTVAKTRRDYKKDLRLYRETDYQLIKGDDLSVNDFPRLVELYNLLYLQRYSMMNPQFTEAFLRQAWEQELLKYYAFRKDGVIDGFLAYYTRRGYMTQPLFGYDTARPQEAGLYRLLSMQVTLESEATGNQAHNSAGVGKFKRLRGGVGVNEYNAVYTRHLSTKQTWAWQTLGWLMNRVAVPIIDKYGF